ncbi:hypothetical protein B0H17DRAFT_1151534 [Mycena rosella]|uniref:Uncharacterized protein n=1 Tax=Mycena rosella TaxID=1033263 RepID=A0AAD7FGK1_MYCRO|nr:hypothetical protein B0H17DRAFT_1151534 [Mycena rosella]
MTRHEFSDAVPGALAWQLVAKLVHKAHSSNPHRSEHHPPGHLGERLRMLTAFKIELTQLEDGKQACSPRGANVPGEGSERPVSDMRLPTQVAAVVAASGGLPGDCVGALCGFFLYSPSFQAFLGTSARLDRWLSTEDQCLQDPSTGHCACKIQTIRKDWTRGGSRGIQIEKYPKYPLVRDSPPREAP